MVHVVIFAGGVGSRMGNQSCPKQFLKIEGKEIIVHTIEHFQKHPEVDDIFIACHPDWIGYMEDLVARYSLTKVRSVVEGGATGQLSIRQGLLAASRFKSDAEDIVLIHDGVRPLIDQDLISSNICSVREHGSAISSTPAVETILHMDGDRVREVEDRASRFYAKAPQSFRLDDILSCHEKALSEGRTDFIDSCTMMEHYGYSLHLVPCSYDNIKVTTPADYYLAKALLTHQGRSVDEG